MNIDLLKILSDSNKDIDNQKLMDYLAGQLTEKENHEIEKWMADSEFANDAVEGLQEVKNKKELETLVEQLNNDLNRKLKQKKTRKDKRKIKEFSWIYFAIILILILVTIAWVVIHHLNTAR